MPNTQETGNPNKKFDMLALSAKNQSASASDFISAGITADNMYLKSPEEYKRDPAVRNSPLFKDSSGYFSNEKFDAFYEKAALTSAALVELQLDAIARQIELNALDINDIEYDPSKVARTLKVGSVVIRDLKTPTTTGLTTVFKDLSTEEIAQKNTILNKDGSKKSVSANDMGFWGTLFTNKTYAIAQWDSDGFHTLPTGILVEHKKGEIRLDDNGNPMYEDITGKSTWNRNTLRAVDVITKDDGLGDRWKFWDQDSLEKSWQLILIPAALKIAPIFIPGAGLYYGLSTAIWNTAKLGLAITEDSNKTNSFRNAASGWFKKFETNGISMDNEVDTAFFSLNSLSGLVGDVVIQNSLQRGIAQTIQKFKSRGRQLTKPLQKISQQHAAAYAKEFSGRSLADDIINNSIKGKWASKIDAKMLAEQAKKITAATASASNWSKGYMVLTQALGMDPELREMGMNWYERSITMALAGAGFAAIMSTDLGEIALRGLGYDDVEIAVRKAALELAEETLKSLAKVASASPAVLKTWFKNTTTKIANKAKMLMSTDNILSSAMGEAIEESAEQIVENLATLAVSAISPTVEFEKSLGDVLEEIGQAAFGGAVGGAVFMASDANRRKHLFNFKTAIGNDNYKHLIMMSANGYTLQILSAIDKLRGKTGLSTTLGTELVADKDKKPYFKGASGKYLNSHEGVVLESLKSYVKGLSTIINEESRISSFGVDEDTKRMKEYVAQLIMDSDIGKTMYRHIADVLADAIDAYVDFTSSTDLKSKKELEDLFEFLKDRYQRITGAEAVKHYTNMLAFGMSNGLSSPFYDNKSNNVVSFAARFGENYYALPKHRQNYYRQLFKKLLSNETVSLELAFDRFSKVQNSLGKKLDNIFNWTGKDVSEGIETVDQTKKAKDIIRKRLAELLRKYTEDGNKSENELENFIGGEDIPSILYNGEDIDAGRVNLADYLAGNYSRKSSRSKSVVQEIIDNLKQELSNNGIDSGILDGINHLDLANMLVGVEGKNAKSLDDILNTVGNATYTSLVNLSLELRDSFFQLLANLQELTAETRSTEIAEVDAVLEKYKRGATEDEIISKTNFTHTTSTLSKDDMIRQWLLEQDTVINGKTAKQAVNELLLAKYQGGYSLDDISAIRSAGGLSKFFRMKNNHLIISTANKIIAMTKGYLTPLLTFEAIQTLKDILPILKSMLADDTASDIDRLIAVGNVEFELVNGKFTGNAWLKNSKGNKFGIMPADVAKNPTAEIVSIEGTDSFLYKITAKYTDDSGVEQTIEYYLTQYGYILTTINGEYLDLKVDTISPDVVRVLDSKGYSYIRSAGITLMYTAKVKPIENERGKRLTSYDLIKDTSTGKQAIYNSVDNRVVAYLEKGDSFSPLVLGVGYKDNSNNIPASNVIFTIQHEDGSKSVIDGFGRQHVVKYAGNVEIQDDSTNYELVLYKPIFDEAGNESSVVDSRKLLLTETIDSNAKDTMDLDDTIIGVENLLKNASLIDLPTTKIVVEMYKERFGDDISEYIIQLDGKIKSIDDLIKFKEVVSDLVIKNLESVLQLVLAGLFSLVTDATTPFTAVLKGLNFELPKSTDKYLGLTRLEAEILAKDMSDMFNKINMVKILGSAGGLNALDETYNISTKAALAFVRDLKDGTGSLSGLSTDSRNMLYKDGVLSGDEEDFIDNLYNSLLLNPSTIIDDASFIRVQNIQTKILDGIYESFNKPSVDDDVKENALKRLASEMSSSMLGLSFSYSSLDYSLATGLLDAKVMFSILRSAITTSWSDVASDFRDYAKERGLVYSPVQALNAFMTLSTVTEKDYFDLTMDTIKNSDKDSTKLKNVVSNLQLIIGGAGSGKTSVILDFVYKSLLKINKDVLVKAIAIDSNKKDNYINHLGMDRDNILAMNPFVESILNEDGRALYKAFITVWEESLAEEKAKTSKIDVDKLREHLDSVEHGNLKLSDLVWISKDNLSIKTDLSKLFTEEFVDASKVPNVLFVDEYTQVPVYIFLGLSGLNMQIIGSGDPTLMCNFIRHSNNREWVQADSLSPTLFTSQQFRATNNVSATNFAQLYKINSTYLTVKEPFVNKIISDGLSLIRFSHYFDSENNLYGVHQHTGYDSKVDPKLVLAVKNMVSKATKSNKVVVITPELGSNSRENENFLPKEIKEILDSNKDVVKYEPVSKSQGMTYENVIIGNALDGSSLHELNNTLYSEEKPSSYRLATLAYKRLNTAITRASKAAIIFNHSDKTAISQDLFREAKILSSIDTLAMSNQQLALSAGLKFTRSEHYKPEIDTFGMSSSDSDEPKGVQTKAPKKIVLRKLNPDGEIPGATEEIGKIGNTKYEVKSDGVYFEGKKLDNPDNLPARELVEEHIEERQQENLNKPIEEITDPEDPFFKVGTLTVNGEEFQDKTEQEVTDKINSKYEGELAEVKEAFDSQQQSKTEQLLNPDEYKDIALKINYESRNDTESDLKGSDETNVKNPGINISKENIELLNKLIVSVNGINIFRFPTYYKDGLFGPNSPSSPVVVANVNDFLVPFVYTKVEGEDNFSWKPFVSINSIGIPHVFSGGFPKVVEYNTDILKASKILSDSLNLQVLSENLNQKDSKLLYEELMKVLSNFGFLADGNDIVTNRNREASIQLLQKISGIDASNVEASEWKNGEWVTSDGKINHLNFQLNFVKLVESAKNTSADEEVKGEGEVKEEEEVKGKGKVEGESKDDLDPLSESLIVEGAYGKKLYIGIASNSKEKLTTNDSEEKLPPKNLIEFNPYFSASGCLFNIEDLNFDQANRWNNFIIIPNKDLGIQYGEFKKFDKFGTFNEFKTAYIKLLRASYLIFRILTYRDKGESIQDYIKNNIDPSDVKDINEILGIETEDDKSHIGALSEFLGNGDKCDIVINVVATASGIRMESGIAGGTQSDTRTIELALRIKGKGNAKDKFITLGKFDGTHREKFFKRLDKRNLRKYIPYTPQTENTKNTKKGDLFKLTTITDENLISTIFDSADRILKINSRGEETSYTTLTDETIILTHTDSEGKKKTVGVDKFTPLTLDEYILAHPWHKFYPVTISTDKAFLLKDRNGNLIPNEVLKHNTLLIGVPFDRTLDGEKDLASILNNSTLYNDLVLVRFDRDNIKSFDKLREYILNSPKKNEKSLKLLIPDTLVPKLLSTYQRAYTNPYSNKNITDGDVNTLPESILSALKKTFTDAKDVEIGILLTNPEYASMHSHLFNVFKTIASTDTFEDNYFNEKAPIRYNKDIIENCLKYLFNDNNFGFATLLTYEDYKAYKDDLAKNEKTEYNNTENALSNEQSKKLRNALIKLKSKLSSVDTNKQVLLVDDILKIKLKNKKNSWNGLKENLVELTGLTRGEAETVVSSFRQFSKFVSDNQKRFMLVINETVVYSNNDIAAGLISAGVVADVTNGAYQLKDAFIKAVASNDNTEAQFIKMLTRMFDETDEFLKDDLKVEDEDAEKVRNIIDRFFKRGSDKKHTFFLYNQLTEFSSQIKGSRIENAVGENKITTPVRVVESFPIFSDANFEKLFTRVFPVPLSSKEDGKAGTTKLKSESEGKQTPTDEVKSLNTNQDNKKSGVLILGEFNFDENSLEKSPDPVNVSGGVGPKISYDNYMEGVKNAVGRNGNQDVKNLANNLIYLINSLTKKTGTTDNAIKNLYEKNPETIGNLFSLTSMKNFGKALIEEISDAELKGKFKTAFPIFYEAKVNDDTIKCI